jgi:hypothetical protein
MQGAAAGYETALGSSSGSTTWLHVLLDWCSAKSVANVCG